MVNEQEAQNAQIQLQLSAPPAFPSSTDPPPFRGITTEQTTREQPRENGPLYHYDPLHTTKLQIMLVSVNDLNSKWTQIICG
jgi:hypothetical protein